MMAVKFIKGMSPYQAGEIAGFPESEARRLIQSGVAEEYTAKTKEAESKTVKAPPADKMVNTAPNKAKTKPKAKPKKRK